MALGSIAQSHAAQAGNAEQLDRNRGAVTVRLGSAPFQGTLVTDCAAGKAGTQVKLRQSSETWGLNLADAIKGRNENGKTIHPSVEGDIIVFESGMMVRDELVVGRIAGRTHDGIQGQVQVMKRLTKMRFIFWRRPTKTIHSDKKSKAGC